MGRKGLNLHADVTGLNPALTTGSGFVFKGPEFISTALC